MPDINLSNRIFSGQVKTVAIVGLGLLGGSLALRLKNQLPGTILLGLARRRQSIDEAIARGMIDEGDTAAAAILPKADLTVVCTPVSAIIDLVLHNASLWRPGSVVTDVGSVKGKIAEALTPALAGHGVRFAGSHPMAGSEKSGLAHADAGLYEGSTVIMTPMTGTDKDALALVEKLWTVAGAFTVKMDPQSHDRLLGRTSHLLHLLAAAAVDICLDADANAIHGTGGGFRDFTRIAASSSAMWGQIFKMNADALGEAIDEYQLKLNTLRDWIRDGHWDQVQSYFAKTGDLRTQWFNAWSKRQHCRQEEKNTDK